jgi:hypothetical protein
MSRAMLATGRLRVGAPPADGRYLRQAAIRNGPSDDSEPLEPPAEGNVLIC